MMSRAFTSVRHIPRLKRMRHSLRDRGRCCVIGCNGNIPLDRTDAKPISLSVVNHCRLFSTTEISRGSESVDLCADLSGLNRRRQIVARSIPRWLNKDSTWRERTMEFLQLPIGSSKQAQETLKQEYRSFYKSALKSFADKLLEPAPPEIFRAMDELADAGFADEQFSKKYRDTQTYLNREKNTWASLNSLGVILRRRCQTWEKSKLDLSKLKLKMEQMSNEKSRLDAGYTRHEKRVMGETIDARQNLVDEMALEIDKLNSKYEGSKQILSELERPMDATQYENAHHATLEVLDEICRAFASHIEERHSEMVEQFQELDLKTDMTKPHEWFPRSRLDRRRIIYHGGPTNSGKTYMALERLKTVKRGMYVGPLRLLAAEVYEKLTAAGIYCNLYTGQERREIPFATHGAATVEMASTVEDFDVIVIDEIQMMEDPERGAAWTKALLGSRCKEIHVCGGLEAKDIVERMAKACGDDFELRKYERFSELTVASHSLSASTEKVGSYVNVQPGDCIVAFSKNDIFAIQREIEDHTNYKCCVIYGSLPPETRSEQARRFNDQDSGYDILVASDAIAMGLNLSIRRIVFNSIYKHDGSGTIRLGHSAVKQISGRAGRRNSPYPVGEVTCRAPEDLAYIRECMTTEISSIPKAGLMPTTRHIEMFSEALAQSSMSASSNKLHTILLRFNDMATIQSDFFMCRQTPMYLIAKFLSEQNISIRDKYSLCMCPIQMSCKQSMETLKRFASKLAAGEVSGLKRSSFPRRPKSFEELSLLCSIFSQLDVFLWLQKKFPPGNVMEEQTALTIRDQVIQTINESLKQTDRLRLEHCYVDRDLKVRETWKEAQSDSEAWDYEDNTDVTAESLN